MGVDYGDTALEVGQEVETTCGVYGTLVKTDPPTIQPGAEDEYRFKGRTYCVGTVEEIKRIFLPGGGVLPWPPPESCPCPGCNLPPRHGRRLGDMGGKPFDCESCHLAQRKCPNHLAQRKCPNHDGPIHRVWARLIGEGPS